MLLPNVFRKAFAQNLLKRKMKFAPGIDEIFFMAVNDPFVMAYWGKQYNKPDSIRMIGDPEGSFTKEIAGY